MLSRMMLSGANVLLFDNPSDHLDLESITSLNKALINLREPFYLEPMTMNLFKLWRIVLLKLLQADWLTNGCPMMNIWKMKSFKQN